MPSPLPEALARVREALLDRDHLVRAVAAGRRRGQEVPLRRIELRYVDVKAGRWLQVTSYDETQAHTRNVTPGPDAEAAVDELLGLPFGNWHVDTTADVIQLRVTKKGEAQLHTQRRSSERAPDRGHDRDKPRMLPADDPVFHAVGIADHRGRVKSNRQAKYRQVDEFLRVLDAAVDTALESRRLARPTPQRPLRLVDLGCGNAYLTFACVRYLDRVRGFPVRMEGIDTRTQARERNTELAARLGYDDRVAFRVSAIAAAEPSEPPDVVLALHACDTATDDALARAVAWRAPLVLAAPCCHHDIQTQLDQASVPSPYTLVSRHGILRERMADVLTDALRASILRQHGYRVDVIEFVASKHTHRNVLLRAIRTGAAPAEETHREYTALTEQWGVRPALARMVEG